MLKKVLIGIAALVVVLLVAVGGGFYYLYSNLDAIVKAAIESYGGDATQAKVSVKTVKLSLTSGEGTISGLVVGNPSGFATPQALSLGSVSMKVDTASVTRMASDIKAPLVIKEVVIASPAITYERGTSTGNLEKIQENVTRYAGLDKSKPAAKPAAGGKEEPKLIIENLYVRDGTDRDQPQRAARQDAVERPADHPPQGHRQGPGRRHAGRSRRQGARRHHPGSRQGRVHRSRQGNRPGQGPRRPAAQGRRAAADPRQCRRPPPGHHGRPEEAVKHKAKR